MFEDFLSVDSFMPHGYCLLWKPTVLWTIVTSDAVITTAYFSIPIVLLFFAKQRRDLPFKEMFLLFGLFIFLCGTTHLVDIFTIWNPIYGTLALVKAATALVSILTAVTLIPLIPKVL